METKQTMHSSSNSTVIKVNGCNGLIVSPPTTNSLESETNYSYKHFYVVCSYALSIRARVIPKAHALTISLHAESTNNTIFIQYDLYF